MIQCCPAERRLQCAGVRMKTYTPSETDIQRRWWLVDAEGKVLGRLASRIAGILRGKHKPIYTPHLDTGDYVVVINAAKVRLTGDKPNQKTYFRPSGYKGGERFIPFRRMIEKQDRKSTRLNS